MGDFNLNMMFVGSRVHNGRVRKRAAFGETREKYEELLYPRIVSDLLGAPWNVIEMFDSIDDKWNCWKSIFQSLLDRHVPMKEVRVKRSSLPWITAEVLEVNRARNYFRKKHRRTGNDNDWECYGKLRNLSKMTLTKAKMNYFECVCFTSARNPRKAWNERIKVLGRKMKH